jgi:Kef-type K+ transport system membrane component KefB
MKTKVHYGADMSPTLNPTLSQIKIHSTPSYIISVRFILISFHLQLNLLSVLCPSCFPAIIVYAFIISPISATCPVRIILIDLNILIFAE